MITRLCTQRPIAHKVIQKNMLRSLIETDENFSQSRTRSEKQMSASSSSFKPAAMVLEAALVTVLMPPGRAHTIVLSKTAVVTTEVAR
jgi:hypothetical protein